MKVEADPAAGFEIPSGGVHEDLQWTLFESLGWKSCVKYLVRDVGNVLRV
jgi:hypothetical protein